jgi:hypothetical protein
MFTVLILRQGPIHIVNWRQPNGGFRTVCSKTFTRSDLMNVIAADNTFPGICSTCKRYTDEMYQSDLDTMPRSARSRPLADVVEFNRADFLGPRAKFEDILVRRVSTKIIKYQRLRNRTKKYDK